MSGTNAHWLDDYGSERFRWRETRNDQQQFFYRPLGHTESLFDSDGRYYEGRADINSMVEMEVKSRLTEEQLHEKILLAWTCLRSRHSLLRASAVKRVDIGLSHDDDPNEYCFRVHVPRDVEEAKDSAKGHIVFLGDHYEAVDTDDFWYHAQNSARVFDPAEALSRLFVFPLLSLGKGRALLRLLIVGSHQIWDGMTTSVWFRDFTHFLNKSTDEQKGLVCDFIKSREIEQHLPLPQEALYPPISGSKAKQRWFWAITRILRHVRKPLQAGFASPLWRREPLRPIPPSPTYAAVLDYTRTPPLNSGPCFLEIPMPSFQRLIRCCREAKASIGAGCFVLAALVMMEMYEKLEPNVPLHERKPFISGFPLNPRPFFNHHVDPDSLMLAFCDGIVLPFLPSSLPIEGRLRLLARQAHRQLATYQKRRPAGEEEHVHFMSSRGAGRVIANQYLIGVERSQLAIPEEWRTKAYNDPQGEYQARPNTTRQTNGVSSLGRRDAMIRSGMYDIEALSDRDFVADFSGMKSGVRARDGEFLVGIGGSEKGLGVGVSIDFSGNDPELVQEWKERMSHILDDPPKQGQKARL
ncbi:hypothetical protein D0864_09745 [Hortaea werneckii]|uniref:Condensation domain-containing protein n=1 Tax=Hortaea werneckii TaxID=91943 RepID=A0A3M7EHA1_HORWE|nr:hypothetical protein D0864_09745 [Hortaea werneckii]